ncbi:MAG: zinc-binding dehydrogenase [Saprospiraceae bacterium]|nr:zinc-binding dehydrogenase [Saprospiraceae bacterium]
MKALVLESKNQAIQYKDVPDPQPSEGQVIVQLKSAALNRRDYFITQGLYPNIIFPCILGSDGAGLYNNREIIINPNNNWGDNTHFQSKEYHILGLPKQGTLAKYIAIGEDRLVDKPVHLTWEQAAALPLAGMTAYRALFTKGQVKAGDRVLITGIGGGVALFAMQFAIAAGAKVFVTSGTVEKITKAMEMGAAGGVNYNDKNWNQQLVEQAGSFDIILDSAGGESFVPLPKLCNPGGRIVIYGGTLGKIPEISPQIIFWRQLSILGTTMATDAEFKDMIHFVNEYKILPVVDSVFDLKHGNAAFEKLAQSDQFGKIVININ